MKPTDPHPGSYPVHSKADQREGNIPGTFDSPRPAKYPGRMPYNPQFVKDNSIVQQLGVSDVPISEPLLDIVSRYNAQIQQGHSVIARPTQDAWEPSPTRPVPKGPWRPKGADPAYRKASEASRQRSDRGPGGTDSY